MTTVGNETYFATFVRSLERAGDRNGILGSDRVVFPPSLDFRYAASNWREAYPRLATWYDAVSQRPSVLATAVTDDAAPAPKDTHSLIDFTQSR